MLESFSQSRIIAASHNYTSDKTKGNQKMPAATKNNKSKSQPGGVRIDPDRIYNAHELCEVLQISRRQLAYQCRTRGLPMAKVGGGRAVGSAVIEWLKTQQS